jgi:hypothetical protein
VRFLWENPADPRELDEGFYDCTPEGDVFVCLFVRGIGISGGSVPYGVVLTVAPDPLIGHRVQAATFTAAD